MAFEKQSRLLHVPVEVSKFVERVADSVDPHQTPRSVLFVMACMSDYLG